MPPAPESRPALGPLDGLMTLAQRLKAWRGQRRASPAWTLLVAGIVAIMLLPVLTVLVLAFGASPGALAHLARTILPDALAQTLILMTGVGGLTLAVGTSAAWIVTMYRFPGRAVIDRLLVLPLAMPTYIIAYAYVDLLDYTGPLQSGLRWLTGWRSVRDYWFPEVRSTTGATLILASVLYPYVYLAARASFVQQSVCALEVARTLGRTPFGAFTSVALPLARPALVAGVALALMECLNDLGAVQYLGVRTLSASIYTTWLQRSNLAGAAQIDRAAAVRRRPVCRRGEGARQRPSVRIDWPLSADPVCRSCRLAGGVGARPLCAAVRGRIPGAVPVAGGECSPASRIGAGRRLLAGGRQ